MGRDTLPQAPLGSDAAEAAALQHGPWRMRAHLSSGLEQAERFLVASRQEQGPWVIVAMGLGITLWFLGANAWQWTAVVAAGFSAAILAGVGLRADGAFPFLRRAVMFLGLALCLGCLLIWAKSSMVGVSAIERPIVAEIEAVVLSREDQPAEQRIRLLVATREPGSGRAIKVRLNVPHELAIPELDRGARIRLRARLIPPPGPMLPGSYDFARSAWFSGISATGSAIETVQILTPGQRGALARWQQDLSDHVQRNIPGSAGAIAAAFASGDRGAIAQNDDQAMRDAGLTHLLSISGLHVSAVVAAGYFIILRLLGLIPWLALRTRLPIVAAGAGAVAGIGYTLLTGAELPTIRSCIAAILVLLAMAIGRDPLSMRMVAIGAFIVLLFWPEALIGPSFQMSFAAVIAIVALHGSKAMRAFNAPREEGWAMRAARQVASLLLTGIVIELALMPIVLFHFHRAGIYGALANVVAIPLTTFVAMPLIALALLFDLLGLGSPLWWLAGASIHFLLGLAHGVAALPGAVTAMPSMGRWCFALFVSGLLWLALWQSRVRFAGFVPLILGCMLVLNMRSPDLLVSGEGRHVGITSPGKAELLLLRESRSGYARDNLVETAGMSGETRQIADWPGAACNQDFCAITLRRDGQDWLVLIGRGPAYVSERALAAACDRADIVIAPRYLPRSCQPRWIKADRRLLDQTGGLTIDLVRREVRTVAQDQGEHGWWRKGGSDRDNRVSILPRSHGP